MKPKTLIATVFLAWSAIAGAADGFAALDRAAAARLADPASHGAPTVVALWSLDCVHCKKNLKLFAELGKLDARVRLVTVAVQSEEAGLAEPLDRLGVPGQRFAYGADAPEALAFALDAKWRGELPRTLLFDGRGGKATLSGVVSEADARRALGLAAR